MLKLIGVFLVLTTCHVSLKASDVDERSWVKFLSSGKGSFSGVGPGESRCPIQPRCESLGRITKSCDTDSVAVGCGSCLTGFHEDGSGRCLSGPSLRSGIEPDQLIDNMAPAALMAGFGESENLQLAQRRDSGGSAAVAAASDTATTASGSAARPPTVAGGPPPHSPVKLAPAANPDFAFYVIVGTTCSMGLLLIIICTICWYKYNYASKQAEKDFTNTEFSQTGTAGDGKLALSAQMYHYQHQKQQMLAMDRSSSDLQRDHSDDDSDMGNDEADFTVYECPGLAPTREMEVRNPLFKEDVPETQPSAADRQPSPTADVHSTSGSGSSAAK